MASARDITVRRARTVRERYGYTSARRPQRPAHMVYEVVDNAVDEAMAGHATNRSHLMKEGGCGVVDTAGNPVDEHPDTRASAAEIVLTTRHAGGKFDGELQDLRRIHGLAYRCQRTVESFSRGQPRRRRSCGFRRRWTAGRHLAGWAEPKEGTRHLGPTHVFRGDRVGLRPCSRGSRDGLPDQGPRSLPRRAYEKIRSGDRQYSGGITTSGALNRRRRAPKRVSSSGTGRLEARWRCGCTGYTRPTQLRQNISTPRAEAEDGVRKPHKRGEQYPPTGPPEGRTSFAGGHPRGPHVLIR